jgi:uncharacterized protein YuzE
MHAWYSKVVYINVRKHNKKYKEVFMDYGMDGNLYALDRWMESNEKKEAIASAIIEDSKDIFVDLSEKFNNAAIEIENELGALSSHLEDKGLIYDVHELAEIVSEFKDAEGVADAIKVVSGDC